MTLETSRKSRTRIISAILYSSVLFLAACSSGVAPQPVVDDDDGGNAIADQNLGERLFNDTRFSQYFAAHMTGVNAPLAVGDPVVTTVETINGPLPGPFAGQAINCRSCHFVTEFQGVPNAGNRTYADFIDHSPLPRPLNGFTTTPRNAMQMVGSLQPHTGPSFLHFDGEFATPEDLVKATFTGRNFGWDPTQYQQAVAQMALVIRQDDGRSATLAVVIADDFQGQGLGEALMRRALAAARVEGIALVLIYFLPENTRMRKLSRKLGFAVVEENNLMRGELAL